MDHREVGCCDAPSSYYPHTPHTTARLGKIAVQLTYEKHAEISQDHDQGKNNPADRAPGPFADMGHLANTTKAAKKDRPSFVRERDLSLLHESATAVSPSPPRW